MKKDIQSYKPVCLFIFLFICQLYSLAQPGELDSAFNGNGREFTLFPGTSMIAFASAIQTDGKLLVAGSGDGFDISGYNCIILRYNDDGTLDNSFGNGGEASTDFGKDYEDFFSVTVQQDGRILAGGISGVFGSNQKGILARYNMDGGLDSSFGINGKIITDYGAGANGVAEVQSVKVLPGGKILTVGGRSAEIGLQKSGIIARYFSNGILDSSFGINGILESVDERNFEVQDDGKLIFVGYRTVGSVKNFEVTRYLPDGQLDLDFNGKGYVDTYIDSLGASAGLIAIQPDEKILIAGIVYNEQGSDFAIVRYTNNGTIDTSFGASGIVVTSFYERNGPSKMALQADGKILVAGTGVHNQVVDYGIYVLARYFPNGNLDSSFGDNGKKKCDDIFNFRGGCTGMVLKNHRIYLTGYEDDDSPGFNTFAIQNDGIPLSTTNLCPGITGIIFSAGLPGASYQWQLSTDHINFNNISNNGNYTGTMGSTLFLNNIPSSWNGYHYRCVVDQAISDVFTIHFSNTWTGEINNAWNNPYNWSCGTVPDNNTDVVIKSGAVFINSDVSARSVTIKPGAIVTVSPGYVLTITHSNSQSD